MARATLLFSQSNIFLFGFFFYSLHPFDAASVRMCVGVFAYELLNLAYFKFITLGLQPGAVQIKKNNNNTTKSTRRHRYTRAKANEKCRAASVDYNNNKKIR